MSNNNQTVKTRHALALLTPEAGEESTLSTLFTQLTLIADRYKGDSVMAPAITGLAEVIEKLAGDGNTGRIDGSLLLQQVRDTVSRSSDH